MLDRHDCVILQELTFQILCVLGESLASVFEKKKRDLAEYCSPECWVNFFLPEILQVATVPECCLRREKIRDRNTPASNLETMHELRPDMFRRDISAAFRIVAILLPEAACGQTTVMEHD
jgi:hypothetical protein